MGVFTITLIPASLLNMEYASHTQDDLRQSLTRQYRQDVSTLISHGRWPPPWQNDDFAIQNDEGRLLSAIADNAGLPWRDDSAALCKRVTDLLGMTATGNAKATVKRCIVLGYVRARYDRDMGVIMLDLTDLGASMLELWEDEQEDNAE